jgi:hypothetical protein
MEGEPRQVGLVIARLDDRDQPPPPELVGFLVPEQVAGLLAHGDDLVRVVGGGQRLPPRRSRHRPAMRSVGAREAAPHRRRSTRWSAVHRGPVSAPLGTALLYLAIPRHRRRKIFARAPPRGRRSSPQGSVGSQTGRLGASRTCLTGRSPVTRSLNAQRNSALPRGAHPKGTLRQHPYRLHLAAACQLIVMDHVRQNGEDLLGRGVDESLLLMLVSEDASFSSPRASHAGTAEGGSVG